MVKTTIQHASSKKNLYEFDMRLSHDCVKNYDYRDKNGRNFFARNHIITEIVEELEEIIYYVETLISDDNVTMVYLTNWKTWTATALENWDEKVRTGKINIALVSFAIPYLIDGAPPTGTGNPYLCSNTTAAYPNAPKINDELAWTSHSTFIKRLKEKDEHGKLKVLLSYGGRNLGCCPIYSGAGQETNFLAEQIKYYINEKGYNNSYKDSDEKGQEEIRKDIVKFLSDDIVSMVNNPDSTNQENAKTCKKDLLYSGTPYTSSGLESNLEDRRSNKYNYIDNPLITDLSEEDNLGYDGVDFDYEIDYSFDHTQFALKTTANIDSKVEIPPGIDDSFATDISNVIIEVMKEVNSSLNPDKRTKLITTVPFISHFEEPNLYNKGLKDISNIIDFVGIQAYNQAPFILPGYNDMSGICNDTIQENFKKVLSNINDTVGLDKTIILLSNLYDVVGFTNNNAGGDASTCGPPSWAKDTEIEVTVPTSDKKLYLVRQAKCYLGTNWNDKDSKPKNERQKSKYDDGANIQHKPLIDITEIVQSLDSLAFAAKQPTPLINSFDVTPSNEEYYCGTDYNNACTNPDESKKCSVHSDCDDLKCINCADPPPPPLKNKLQFRGMGYWGITGENDSEIEFANIMKDTMDKYTNKETIDYTNAFNYCEETVPTGIKELDRSKDDAIIELRRKKHGCPLIVNPLTNIDDIPNTSKVDELIPLTKEEQDELPSILRHKGPGDVYHYILKQKCNIDIGDEKDENKDIVDPVLPCADSAKGIIFNNSKTCSYNQDNIISAVENRSSIVVSCKGLPPMDECVDPPEPIKCTKFNTYKDAEEEMKKKAEEEGKKLGENKCTNIKKYLCNDMTCEMRQGPVYNPATEKWMERSPVCNRVCEDPTKDDITDHSETGKIYINCKNNINYERDNNCGDPKCQIETMNNLLDINRITEYEEGKASVFTAKDGYKKLNKFFGASDASAIRQYNWGGYHRCTTIGNDSNKDLNNLMDIVYWYEGVDSAGQPAKKSESPYTMIGCKPGEIATSDKLANRQNIIKACDKDFPTYNCLNDGENLTDNNEDDQCKFINYNSSGGTTIKVGQDCGDWHMTVNPDIDKFESSMKGWGRKCRRSCRNCAEPRFNPELCQDHSQCKTIGSTEADSWSRIATLCDPRNKERWNNGETRKWWTICPRTCSQVTEYLAWKAGTVGKDGLNGRSSINNIPVGYEAICKRKEFNPLWTGENGVLNEGLGHDTLNNCTQHSAALSATPEVNKNTATSNTRDNIRLKAGCIETNNSWRKNNCSGANPPYCGSNEKGGNWGELGDRGFAGNYKYNTAIRVKNVEPPVSK